MNRPVPAITSCALVLLLLFLLGGCSTLQGGKRDQWTTYDDVPALSLAMNGIKIGLLADTRNATEQNLGTLTAAGEKSATPDSSTRRPPALNHLAPDMLAYALRRLIDEEQVDVILYLGNGAESGCSDELRMTFDILEQFRDGQGTRHGKHTPIFYVIGNHDYLGGGYTPAMPQRNRLCFDSPVSLDTELNTPVDKFQLITLVHNFNQGNFDGLNSGILNKWRYTDNYNERRLYQACVVNDKNRYQHIKAGCYLAGKLVYKDGSEILLADSSDYHDEVGSFASTTFKKEWYGLSGWVSSLTENDATTECSDLDEAIVSQARWYQCQQASRRPPVRIIAAHYPLTSLSPIARVVLNNQDTLCNLSPLFLPGPSYGNFWFSANTMLAQESGEVKFNLGLCKKEKSSAFMRIGTLNIGSTVDYDRSLDRGTTEELARTATLDNFIAYEPGAFVTSIAKVKSLKGSQIVTRHISPDIRRCGAVLSELRRQPSGDSPPYVPVRDNLNYRDLFGMGMGFLESDWTRYDHVYAHLNLERLIGHLTSFFADDKGLSEEDVRMCLALETSRLANVPQVKGFECKTCPTWRKMRRIEFEERANY